MRCRQIFNCHYGSMPFGTMSKHHSQPSRLIPKHGCYEDQVFTMSEGWHLRFTDSEIWYNEVFSLRKHDIWR